MQLSSLIGKFLGMGVVLAMVALVATSSALAAPQPASYAAAVTTWSPPSLPAECPTSNVFSMLVDVSRSMTRDRLFDQVKKEVAGYVQEAPGCQLVVISTFGTTADVRAGRFIVEREDRTKLQEVINGLRADQAWTNFDEAVKHLEWLVAKLGSAYGVGDFTLRVVALSDDEPSPSPEKPSNAPSLREWLQEHFPGGRLSAAVVQVTTDRAAATAAPETGTGTVFVRDLPQVFHQAQSTAGTDAVRSKDNRPALAPAGRLDRAKVWVTAHPRTFVASFLLLALTFISFCCWLSVRDDGPLPGGPSHRRMPGRRFSFLLPRP